MNLLEGLLTESYNDEVLYTKGIGSNEISILVQIKDKNNFKLFLASGSTWEIEKMFPKYFDIKTKQAFGAFVSHNEIGIKKKMNIKQLDKILSKDFTTFEYDTIKQYS